MKKHLFISSFVFFIVLQTGCWSNEPLNDIPLNLTTVEDPMKKPIDTLVIEDITDVSTEAITDEGQNYITRPKLTSYGLQFKQDDIFLWEDGVKITPKLLGDEDATTVGMFVLVDGMPQEYFIEDSEEKTYIGKFNIEAKSDVDYSLQIDAKFDSNIGDHIISVLSVLLPDFVPQIETPFFGNYHRGASPSAKKIIVDDNKDIIQESHYTDINALKADNTILTQEQIDRYNIGAIEGGTITDVMIRQNRDDENEAFYIKKGDEKNIKLTFTGYTTNHMVEDYRITFYVNHKLVTFNEYSCIDMTMEGGKIVEIDIELKNINVGDFIYCIAAPLFEGGVTIKSTSKMVVSE